jgi:hypothetical protein
VLNLLNGHWSNDCGYHVLLYIDGFEVDEIYVYIDGFEVNEIYDIDEDSIMPFK